MEKSHFFRVKLRLIDFTQKEKELNMRGEGGGRGSDFKRFLTDTQHKLL